LSDAVKVGILRIEGNFASFLKTSESEAMALAVGSRFEVFVAAVY
jgi:hypothetical protein